MELLLGKQVLSMDRSRVMGILNITPDSFSDGGEFLSPDKAIAQAVAMLEDGADIIDVGGESTRPGADSVPLQEELDRVIPVIEQISSKLAVTISVDTSKPDVMRAAVAAGAVMVNDVYALRQDGARATAAIASSPSRTGSGRLGEVRLSTVQSSFGLPPPAIRVGGLPRLTKTFGPGLIPQQFPLFQEIVDLAEVADPQVIHAAVDMSGP